jgi:hypothetical protein
LGVEMGLATRSQSTSELTDKLLPTAMLSKISRLGQFIRFIKKSVR